LTDTRAKSPPAIELIGIEKRFGEVRANHDVNLSVAAGSIHGIVGENGAGKSTLMSILYGFYEADAGEIRVRGKPVRIRSSREAIAAGIGMVHQHFMLVQTLSVLENVMLGAEGGTFLAKGAAKTRATLAQLARDYGLVVDPDAIVGSLPVGLQQRVEILKALRTLEREGKTVIFITHKLREIMAITDRVSVMRRGEVVATFDTDKTSPAELADAMVGRKVLLRVDKQQAHAGAVRLDVRDLSVVDALGTRRLDRVSLQLRAGEIVGIAGVSGNGQSELLAALAGIVQPSEGRVLLDGQDVTGLTPAELRTRGLAHVPEDRHGMGLVLAFEENENSILGYHRDPKYSVGPLLNLDAIRADARENIKAYDIQPPDCRLRTAKFSGGNQQKIVLAREIERDPKVLLVGQPTRGVDIGAIEFIHKRLVSLRDQGKAILLVSVELDEIMSLADRIIVMCGGRITGERPGGATDQRDLGLLMAGVTDHAA
jgi:simple sugar transport system ATP-binding protein